MRKCIALVLAFAIALSLTACRKEKPAQNTTVTDPYDRFDSYDDRSAAIYEDALGDFYDAYQAAQQAETVSRRYALMAIAEAKLLGSGVMLPLTAGGGSYTISRAAPYTAPYALWGNDADRFEKLLVTNTPITAAHVEAMKAQWGKLRGTGKYWDWAKQYLKDRDYDLKDTYRIAYSSDPKTWDALATSRASDSRAIVNTYASLYQYDCEGTLQPALAERYEVTQNSDGTVDYTFYLKKGLNWVDSQGRRVAPVQADDFVAGMQHMMDAAGGLEYLVDGLILGAGEYISGEITDFSLVGVKAKDEHTLTYTLIEDVPYFMSMLGYSVFAPMSRSFYQSKGGKFGGEFDASASGYTYGRSPDTIAYCGAYLVTNATAENTIVFRANDGYFDADNVEIETIIWRFNDGKDALKSYQDTLSGAIDGTGLNASSISKAKSDGVFQRLAHVSARDATTYFAFHNLDRQAVENFNDGSAASQKSGDQHLRSRLALRNVHFRRALCFALDRSAYNAQTAGEDLKTTALRNSFTPGTFVQLPEEVTIEIGGQSKTYPAGTDYGQIMQDQLTADGLPVTVWDPNGEAGIGSSDGFDGWYHPEAAALELSIALKELDFSPGEPIVLEIPYFSGSDAQSNRVNAYKQSVEKALGGAVRIQPIPCPDRNQVNYAGFYITMGYEANYDIYDLSGWGPDYGDPQTYLGALLPEYEGYMTRMLGIF